MANTGLRDVAGGQLERHGQPVAVRQQDEREVPLWQLHHERGVGIGHEAEVPYDPLAAVELHEPAKPRRKRLARRGSFRGVQAVGEGLVGEHQRRVERGVELRQIAHRRHQPAGRAHAFRSELASLGPSAVVHPVGNGHALEDLLISIHVGLIEQVVRHDGAILQVGARHGILIASRLRMRCATLLRYGCGAHDSTADVSCRSRSGLYWNFVPGGSAEVCVRTCLSVAVGSGSDIP